MQCEVHAVRAGEGDGATTGPEDTSPARLPGQGWLKNRGRPGNWANAPRCGAKTRSGKPCKAPAMRNGRCRMHGGMSTGPRTPEGIAAIKASRTIHGRYSKEAVERRREARAALRALRDLLGNLRLKGMPT